MSSYQLHDVLVKLCTVCNRRLKEKDEVCPLCRSADYVAIVPIRQHEALRSATRRYKRERRREKLMRIEKSR